VYIIAISEQFTHPSCVPAAGQRGLERKALTLRLEMVQSLEEDFSRLSICRFRCKAG
jgi:hypothetical protein